MTPLGRLHIITDTRPGRDPLTVVRAALSVGAPVVQVRVEDTATDREAYELTVRIAALCAQYGATCLVNDRLHVAQAVGAAGVHVGADDLPVEACRRVLGPGAILGATARSPLTALDAVAAGASYLGVGPAYATVTKSDLPPPVGVAGIAAVAATVDVPVIAIGGVTAARVPELLAAGAYGVAVVGAISAAADPARATIALLAEVAVPRHGGVMTELAGARRSQSAAVASKTTGGHPPGATTTTAAHQPHPAALGIQETLSLNSNNLRGRPMTPDVAVVGGGVIGLAVGWRCAQRGLRVRVYDPAPGQGASYASAGMLAPVSETSFGETALTRLLVESAGRWPSFRTELETAAGVDVGYRDEGTLVVALSADDLADVARLLEYQASLGLPISPLRPAELREREPLLSPRLRGGAFAPEDRQVDPRRLVAALRAALDRAGVAIEPRAVSDLSTMDGEIVVVAAGCGTAALTGLPVRPVKGQILRLRAPAGAPPGFRHVIRGYADGRSVYLVPRAGGEVVVGATVEELSDTAVTAGAVLDLLRAAVDLVPELAEYGLAEAAVGHRPGTPDNAPIVGWLDQRRVAVATGHFRHGVVLTPITADGVAELVTTGCVPAVLAPFTPTRFPAASADRDEPSPRKIPSIDGEEPAGGG